MSRVALAWSRIRGSLWSVLPRFRRPAAPEPSRRITTAEAWDLWREACCDERGGHFWETSKYLGRDCDHMAFTCGCCPATLDVYPAGDRIRLPWGITVPVVTRTCKRCGTEFRQVVPGTKVRDYCCRTHANSARKARTRPERVAAQQRAAEAAREAVGVRIALASCAKRNKVRYEDATAAVKATEALLKHQGIQMYPYECPCGYWHLSKQLPERKDMEVAIKHALFGSVAS